jgi:acyl-CoA dehydrogenase
MSDIRDDLEKTIDRICEAHCLKEVFMSSEDGIWPQSLWQALEEVGLPQACLTEAQGGSGLSFEDALFVLRRSAYHAAPVPLAETFLAGRILSAAGLKVPEGVLSVSVSHAKDNLVLHKSESSATLSGHAHRVPWGLSCDHLAVVAHCDGQQFVALLARDVLAQSASEKVKNLAGEPRVQFDFDKTPIAAFAPLENAQERLLTEGALMRSVQMAGALQRSLAYSLQYANDRVQFGRPIGKFQAVQHMLAVLAGHVAATAAAADAAIEVSADAPEPFSIAVAKSRSGEAAGKGAEIAHQVHGAMGFTREHNLHHLTRRLWAWRDEFGNETHWQTRIGEMALAQGPDKLWPFLTSL